MTWNSLQLDPVRAFGQTKGSSTTMRHGPKISVGGLMRLIALIALEMAMFHGMLVLVLIPPITMAVVLLNLAVLFAFRALPPRMANRIGGMLCGGLISIFVLVGYYLTADSRTMLGVGGRALGSFLANLAASRTDPSDALAGLLRVGARSSLVAEIILLDLVGLAIIWASGWIDFRMVEGRSRQRPPRKKSRPLSTTLIDDAPRRPSS